ARRGRLRGRRTRHVIATVEDCGVNVGATLWALVEERADATPDALFAVDARDRRLSFAEYRASASRVAAGLRELGVGEGTLVAWMLPTSLDALVLSAALARLGAVQCPLLPTYRERELGFALRETGAHHLVVASRFRGHDAASMAQTVARDVA